MPTIPPSSITDALKWRYAVKAFDPNQKISAETWAALEEALVLTPSSFGLQPWKFIVIQDQALREKLVPHAWNQRQVADCSHLVVMTSLRQMDDAHIDANIARMVEIRGGTADALLGFRKMVAGFRAGAEQQGWLDSWAKLQVYIALGQLMMAASLLGVDTCPMEGIVPAKYDEILGLKGSGYATCVGCAAGYRASTDKYAQFAKVRSTAQKVVEHR